MFERDVPIFCTGKDELVYIRGGVADSRETEMMQVRCKVVGFNAQNSVYRTGRHFAMPSLLRGVHLWT